MFIRRSLSFRTVSYSQALSYSTKYTADLYPHEKRLKFSKINTNHVNWFRSVLPDVGSVLTDDDAEPYNIDWLSIYKGLYQITCFQ